MMDMLSKKQFSDKILVEKQSKMILKSIYKEKEYKSNQDYNLERNCKILTNKNNLILNN